MLRIQPLSRLHCFSTNSAPRTQHSAPRTQDSALSTQDSALSTQHSGLRTQDSALSTQHPALSTQHSALCTLHSEGGGSRSSQQRNQSDPSPPICEFKLKFRAQQVPVRPAAAQSDARARQKFVGAPPGTLVFAPISSCPPPARGSNLQQRALSQKWDSSSTW